MSLSERRPKSAWKAAPNDLFGNKARMELVNGEQITLCRFEIPEEAELPEHSHPQEQITYVLNGRLRLCIGGVTLVLGPGDVAVVPGSVIHSGRIEEAPFSSVDVFSPPREDFR